LDSVARDFVAGHHRSRPHFFSWLPSTLELHRFGQGPPALDVEHCVDSRAPPSPLLEQLLSEVLAGLEVGYLLRRNVDLLAGLGVPSGAFTPLPDPE